MSGTERDESTERFAAIGALTEQYAEALNAPVGTLVSALSYAESVSRRLADILELSGVSVSAVGGDAALSDLEEALRLARAATSQIRELSSEVREIVGRRNVGPPIRIDLALLVSRVVSRLAGFVPNLAAHVEVLSMMQRPFATHVDVVDTVVEELIRNALIHGFGVTIPDKPVRVGAPDDPALAGARIQIAIGPADGVARIRVWNNGHALEPTAGGSLFSPAATRSSSTRRGMGLFSAAYLLRATLGGGIDLDPGTERGVAFLVTLPESEPDDAEDALSPRRDLRGAGAR